MQGELKAEDVAPLVAKLSGPERARQLNELIVAPLTRTVRGLATEVVLTPEDGMPVVSAINFDHIALAQRDRRGAMLASLPESRWTEVRSALITACGFDAQHRCSSRCLTK
jgi:mRNA interferase MazF